MRAIIGYIGLTLPVVLLLAGAIDGHLESSISAYYPKVGERVHRNAVRYRRLPGGLPPHIVVGADYSSVLVRKHAGIRGGGAQSVSSADIEVCDPLNGGSMV